MENLEQHEERTTEKKKSAVRSIVGWIVYLAILGGLIYGTPVVLSKVLQSEYPMAAITSGSMWPTMKKGDLVFIKGVEGKEEIEIGDIVVYQNPQGFTIHRVVEFKDGQVVTKGDANNTEDTPVAWRDIIGKTVEWRGKPFKISKLGYVSILLNQ